MTTNCPCCGTEIDVTDPAELADQFTGIMSRLIRCMADGKQRSIYRMADYAYADDPSGGPTDVGRSIRVTLSQNRPKLRAAGWDLRGRPKVGGYRLVRVTQ